MSISDRLKSQAGITLVEMLLVTVLLVLSSLIVAAISLQYVQKKQLLSEAKKFVSTYQLAQNSTVNHRQNTNWGVNLRSREYQLVRVDPQTNHNIAVKTFALRHGIVLDWPVGTPNPILFQPPLGQTNLSQATVLKLKHRSFSLDISLQTDGNISLSQPEPL